MIKPFFAIVCLLLCFLFSFFSYKSYCENKQNDEIQIILHTLSDKNIKINLDQTKKYDSLLLYKKLRIFILKNILPKIELNHDLFFKITNDNDDDCYLFQFMILKKSDLYHITYI